MNIDKMRCLNRDVIKYFAVFVMSLNHIAFAFLESGTALCYTFTYIGYFTAITMCYFLVEGYTYTHSKKKYALRLLVFALISQAPYMMALHITQLNMLFSLLNCFLILLVMDKVRSAVPGTLALLALMAVSVFCDWSVMAPVFTILFARFRGSRKGTAAAYAIGIAFLFVFMTGGSINPGTILHSALACIAPAVSGIVITLFYNGKQAQRFHRFSKWFFYIFYPGHLTVLWLIRLALGV